MVFHHVPLFTIQGTEKRHPKVEADLPKRKKEKAVVVKKTPLSREKKLEGEMYVGEKKLHPAFHFLCSINGNSASSLDFMILTASFCKQILECTILITTL